MLMVSMLFAMLMFTTSAFAAEFKVTFDPANGGDLVIKETVGGKFNTPADPTKDHYVFEGWFDGEVQAAANSTKVKKDTTYTAKYLANLYKVLYLKDSTSLELLDFRFQSYDTTFTAIPSPITAGKTFVCWLNPSLDAAWDFQNDKVASEITTLTAKWEVNSYDAVFVADNGSTVPTQTVEFSSKITTPTPEPTKTGYTFLGWFVDDAKWDFETPMPAKDVKLTADWKINTPLLTFDADNGSVPTTQTVTYDTTFKAPEDPEKTGHTFKGWFNGDKEWDFAAATMPDNALTLTAKWDVNSYGLTLDVDVSGEPFKGYKAFEFGKPIPKPWAQKANYTFVGWFDGSVEVKTMPANDVDLTAKWEINENLLTFNADNGSVPTTQTVDFGSKIATPTSEPTKKGYTFKGWFNGDKEWDFVTATMPDSAVNLKAKWEVVSYTLALVDGSKETTQTVAYGADIAAPTKEGHTFLGWFDGDTEVSTMPAKDVKLTAKWKINTYVLVTDADNGSALAVSLMEYEASISAPSDPVKEDFKFLGWFDGDIKWDFAAKMPAKNLTLVAKWDAINPPVAPVTYHKVNFDAAGGTYRAPAKVADGDVVTLPTTTRSGGFTFAGWYTSAGVKVTTLKPTQDIVLTAKWLSTNCNLKSLKVSAGKLSNKFSWARTSYTLKLSRNTSKVTLTPKKISSVAKTYIKVGDGSYKQITSKTLSLKRGKSSTVKIKVIAQDGSARIYKVVVKRAK